MSNWKVGDIAETKFGTLCRINRVFGEEISVTVLWIPKNYTQRWVVGEQKTMFSVFVSRPDEMTVMALAANGELNEV